MLVGIINEKPHSYYIYQENKMLDVIKVGINKIEHLTEENIRRLFASIFSSELTFFNFENGYQVYLDEIGNKRYLKNGVEDFYMFYINNGCSALCFKELDFYEKLESKKFIIKHKNKISVILLNICVVSILTDFALLHISGLSRRPESDFFTLVNGKVTVEDVNSYIDGSSLSNIEKEFLKSSYLIEDVLNRSIYNDSLNKSDIAIRNYELYDRFKNISIQKFSRDNINALGYYNPLKPNCIYMCDDIYDESKNYQDVLAHEFVHLLQVQGYSYIIEPCAEIMSCEYFNVVFDGYKEEVKRIKVLMEIIGPDVVFDYNFINNDESLFSEIKKYLNDNDYNKLIELFKTTPADWGIREKEINEEIDQILSRMYFNKFGKSINDNELIQLIYQGNNEMNIDTDRIYFNKRHEKYNKDFCAGVKKVPLELIDLTNLLKEYKIVKCRYFKYERYDDDSYTNPLDGSVLWQSTVYEPIENVFIYDVDGTQKLGFLYNDKKYSPSEALEKGMIIRKIEVCYSEESPNFEVLKAKEYGHIEIELSDGSICKFIYSYENGWFNPVERYTNVNIMYPPVNSEGNANEKAENNIQRTKK